MCSRGGQEINNIDSKTSDAIALAIRFRAPIYIRKNIMDIAGLTILDNSDEEFLDEKKSKLRNSKETLIKLMQKAVEDEDYRLAEEIKNEINRISK
ncbi:hypothetical protein JBKA6_1183 [Ichthyobacterium seriolicida]|uniref:BFN domain-containing protein n=1 Tax=Ichthyobacterium seriolicida TaxID=242600 RepID=A0A1J1E563_9FLAO|nr:hypothetical protein JBKA6_1183 [Ichthyobacterium seriolicida]